MLFLSGGTLKEGMIDEASAIDRGLISPYYYFPFPLNEVDMKSSKVKPASKRVVVEGNIKIKERITRLPRDTTIKIEGNATVKPSCKISSDKMVYELEVLKGNGDEFYNMVQVLTIKVDSTSPGEIFNKWIIYYGSSSFDNLSSPTTALTMPRKSAATYKPNIYDLEAQLGSGDGKFLVSSVNQVDHNKLSTVLDNTKFSAGG